MRSGMLSASSCLLHERRGVHTTPRCRNFRRLAAAKAECWDGQDIDSPDHRSHVAYGDGTGVNVGDNNGGGFRCPAGWYLIPQISVRMVFTTDANFTAGKWRLSSDAMMPGAPAGSTLHFDYMEGWSPVVKATWQKNCIDGHRSCSAGDLGNGTQIKGIGNPPGGWIRHQLVPLSSLNLTPTMSMAMPNRTLALKPHAMAMLQASPSLAAQSYAAVAESLPAQQTEGLLSRILHAILDFLGL